jgi:hypothetical protein
MVPRLSRRDFIAAGSLLTAGFLLPVKQLMAMVPTADNLPVSFPHFPDTLHTFIWRNWHLVPIQQLAAVLETTPAAVLSVGRSMGLPEPPAITAEQQQRSYLTVIRRNWHLLPEEQLLVLLGWTKEKFHFTLQEDDFFYIKLGSLKPVCQPLKYTEPSPQAKAHSQRIAAIVRKEFGGEYPEQQEPLFDFVRQLSLPGEPATPAPTSFAPRFGYAYFALFGDPLLDPSIDPYPDAYLEKMRASGMDSTWMHIVLSKLTPFPWDASLSQHWEERLNNLAKLVERAAAHGIGIYLYLNEPRFLPLSFFDQHPELKGVTIGDQAALCTSHPAVQQYLKDSLALITEKVPGLAGFFSITASENHTNCWSHGAGAGCPRCASRGPATVIAELNNLYMEGIQKGAAGSKKVPQLIVWDWGWNDRYASDIIPKLPAGCALMSVSEWALEIERGGVKNTIGEYSISAVGPGPRAKKHWALAKQHGLKTIAKIQAGNTWEIASVPYIPAIENVATHAANLRAEKVDGLMLGWTLGGYPSPNLEVVAAIGSNPDITPVAAMQKVAQQHFGKAAPAVVKAWQQFSKAFKEFPYHSATVYFAPLQMGPANLIWKEPTGYAATMVGLPYDDVKKWIGNYPVVVFIEQLTKVAEGFNVALSEMQQATKTLKLSDKERKALDSECRVAKVLAIHYQSVANQTAINTIRNDQPAASLLLEKLLRSEIDLAKELALIQLQDSRFGFEATNHYFYTPADLVEKVINCRELLNTWLPELRKKSVF